MLWYRKISDIWINLFVSDESVRLELARAKQAVELLEMKTAAQSEIIAAYRDSLECFQNEKRLASALHMADLSQLTKPKT